jgi:hypothetical protein
LSYFPYLIYFKPDIDLTVHIVFIHHSYDDSEACIGKPFAVYISEVDVEGLMMWFILKSINDDA